LAAYRALTTGPVRAPAGAHSARARIMLRPRTAGAATIYVDDVAFVEVSAPAEDAAPAVGAAAPHTSGAARTATGSAAGRTSQTSSVAREPGARVAQPPPVYVRSQVLAAAEVRRASGRDVPSWAWILAGGVLAAIALATGTWWYESNAGAP
jgi:hypothetical protein